MKTFAPFVPFKQTTLYKYRILPIVVLAVMTVIVVYLQFIPKNINSNIISKFNNSEIIVCHNTLIISNSNWKLSGNHLINNNSAGYIEIKNCVSNND